MGQLWSQLRRPLSGCRGWVGGWAVRWCRCVCVCFPQRSTWWCKGWTEGERAWGSLHRVKELNILMSFRFIERAVRYLFLNPLSGRVKWMDIPSLKVFGVLTYFIAAISEQFGSGWRGFPHIKESWDVKAEGMFKPRFCPFSQAFPSYNSGMLCRWMLGHQNKDKSKRTMRIVSQAQDGHSSCFPWVTDMWQPVCASWQ